jgi:hypothetical protein
VTIVSPPVPTALPTLRVVPEPDTAGQKTGEDDFSEGVTRGPDHRLAPGILAEIFLFTVALSASVGVARLIQGGLGHGVVLPIFASVLAGGLVCSLVSRIGLPILLAAVLGAAAAALVTVWAVVPGATWAGVPTFTTAHALSADIRTARAVMGSRRTPVPNVPGVILIASISAGLVCVAARTSWEVTRRYRWPLLITLVPTFGMFCYSAPLSARIDRSQTTIFFLVTVLAFLAASDASGRTMRPVGTHDRVRSVFGTFLPTIASSAIALLVLVLAAGALSGTVPVAFPWWDHPGSPSSSGLATGPNPGHASNVSALSLVANLQGAETTASSVKMFVATTAVPTYWEVGILDRFDGTKWVPGADEKAALSGSNQVHVPAEPLLPPTGSVFISRIQIQGYSGRLLPAPPGAQAIPNGIQAFQIHDGLGVVVPSLSVPGETYQVVAPLPSIPALSSGPTSLQQIYADLGGSSSLYLGLPGGIPSEIGVLAHQIVAGATTPLEEAQDLVNYFHNGSFTYTLDPPAVPGGVNPLIWFLNNRAGYCQQYAGAYGVLARELRLPVRLAIGFNAGEPVSAQDPHQYEVTGADAHVWPEVYLGSQLGWVSFEPTPSPANGEPNGSGVVNARTIPSGKGSGVNPAKRITKPISKVRIPLPQTPNSVAPVAPVRHAKRHAPLPAGAIFGSILVVLAVVGGVAFWRRSKRYVRPVLSLGGRNSSDPDHVVLRSWMRASSALGRAGFQRSQWSTPAAHAASVREAILAGDEGTLKRGETGAALGIATYGYSELADLAELACYCPGRCTGRDARHAEQEAWRIERALRNSGMFRWFPTPPPKNQAPLHATSR